MKLLYALLLSFSLLTSAVAQEDGYVVAVKVCIENNGTLAYYDTVLDAMFLDFKTEFQANNIPDSVWKIVEKEKEYAKNGLATMLSRAYKEHFTLQDLELMNELYTSKAGRNMLQNRSLSKKDKAYLDRFYNSATGKKIQNTQREMSASLRRLAKIWINNTSNQVAEVLSEKGYSF
ncbi:DUF2059 domain-containing protein [Bizionia gelidisalsuginis]|uniref:DUF2059 domain-containing protein n=2 Tax=Bizionia TaxID=283785 RepID=A0A8H2LCZ7_9FLAO|nr:MULTISPECIES: DUF2059 domain-containing protein [Bizionia]TYB74527.1 DUF2059 domain-containing protein [Bizionia saleffrena]TYC16319.1 DUF2059 domain-containing protein [Bizionia gelidisalsuginis]